MVAGCRLGNRLLLGLYGRYEAFSHVGETVPLTREESALLRDPVQPSSTSPWTGGPPRVGHWDRDRYDDWVDCDPRLVIEVSYTQLKGRRFRHPVRLLRCRPDRDPRSCDMEQLALRSVS